MLKLLQLFDFTSLRANSSQFAPLSGNFPSKSFEEVHNTNPQINKNAPLPIVTTFHVQNAQALMIIGFHIFVAGLRGKGIHLRWLRVLKVVNY